MRSSLAFLALIPACTTVHNVPYRTPGSGESAIATVQQETLATARTVPVTSEVTSTGEVQWVTSTGEVLAPRRIVDIERRVESRDRSLGALEGGLIGLSLGAATGAMMGYVAGDDADPNCHAYDSDEDAPCTWGNYGTSASTKAVLLGGLLGVIGLGLGGAVGAAIGHPTVAVSHGREIPRVSVVPTASGATAMTSWSF